MSVKFIGSVSGVEADVHATSKGMLVTKIASDGTLLEPKRTYRASTAVVFAADNGTAPFFLLYGSASTVIRVQRIRISGPTLTAVTYVNVNLAKYSTAHSGGTATALTQTPLDSALAAATLNLCSVFTAAPTAGTKVGDLATVRVLAQATTAAASGIPGVVDFDFRTILGVEEIYLRGTNQGVGLYFTGAPGSAVTMALDVEWTEE